MNTHLYFHVPCSGSCASCAPIVWVPLRNWVKEVNLRLARRDIYNDCSRVAIASHNTTLQHTVQTVHQVHPESLWSRWPIQRSKQKFPVSVYHLTEHMPEVICGGPFLLRYLWVNLGSPIHALHLLETWSSASMSSLTLLDNWTHKRVVDL
jgi:hypothetical protein